MLTHIYTTIPPRITARPLCNGTPNALGLFITILNNDNSNGNLARQVTHTLLPSVEGTAATLPISNRNVPTLFTAHRARKRSNEGAIVEYIGPQTLLSIPRVASLKNSTGQLNSALVPALADTYDNRTLNKFGGGRTGHLAIPRRNCHVTLVANIRPRGLGIVVSRRKAKLPRHFL